MLCPPLCVHMYCTHWLWLYSCLSSLEANYDRWTPHGRTKRLIGARATALPKNDTKTKKIQRNKKSENSTAYSFITPARETWLFFQKNFLSELFLPKKTFFSWKCNWSKKISIKNGVQNIHSAEILYRENVGLNLVCLVKHYWLQLPNHTSNTQNINIVGLWILRCYWTGAYFKACLVPP